MLIYLCFFMEDLVHSARTDAKSYSWDRINLCSAMNWGLASWGATLLESAVEVVVHIRLNVSQRHVPAGMNAGSTLRSVDRSR